MKDDVICTLSMPNIKYVKIINNKPCCYMKIIQTNNGVVWSSENHSVTRRRF